MPLRAMLCGELLALSTIVTAAVNAPAAAGVKWPWMTQFAPTARLDPQLFANTKDDTSVPVTLMLVMASVEPPVLVKVTCCEALVVPISPLPNDRLVAERFVGTCWASLTRDDGVVMGRNAPARRHVPNTEIRIALMSPQT